MLIYGAGGHARVIVDCLESQNIVIDGVVESNAVIRDWSGYTLLKDLPGNYKDKECIIAIGSNILRKKASVELHCRYGIARHSSAIISGDAIIGTGTVVFHRVVIQPGVVVGKHVIINTSASIDHDCRLGDYVHISPNATLCGNVSVGEGSHIGANATIIPNLSIGRWCTIGAGAVIIKDVPDFAVVVGNPGKIIKYQKDLE